MKNKNNVYVEVESKEQAETYRKVLEAMGEPISVDYMPWFSEYNLQTAISGNWTLAASATGTKINFGELIELITEQPQKIAVRVDNEKEFNALMKYYDSLGWNPFSDSTKGLFINCEAIEFNDKYRAAGVLFQESDGYKVIPFSDFAKEHNIKLPAFKTNDGVDIYEMDNFWWVQKVNGEYQRPVESCLRSHKPDKDLITFSTKQAALEWIEAQKPKETVIDLGGLTATVKKNGSVIFNDCTNSLSQKDINAIYKALEDLQNG